MRLSRRTQKALITSSLSVLVAVSIIFVSSITTLAQVSGQKVFPSDINMLNVKTDYGAKGDGFTDDTGAIQSALAEGRTANIDYNGKPKSIYFPAGTYLVKDSLEWRGCCLSLQGQGKGISIIKLKNSAVGFGDRNAPKAVIKTPSGNMSFRQNIFDLSVNTGNNNPGAKGIDYIANNKGSIRNVSILAGDGGGLVGLDMSRQWPGPCLIKNVTVDGFDYGIYTKQAEYGVTFENLTLTNQKVVGIRNEGNTLAIRQLNSNNKVPAIQNQESWGSIILQSANLQGGLTTNSAIDNNGYLYARDIVTQGYQSAIRNKGTVVPGISQAEYVSNQVYSVFDSPKRSLNLPIEETPTFNDSNLANWRKFAPRWYGDTGLLQSLLNSGSSTIYFPHGIYFSYSQKTFTVPSTVKRIIGFSSIVNGGGIVFRAEGNTDQPLIIEQFGRGVSVEHASSRPVAIKHGGYQYSDFPGAGKLFLEDVGLRQLNINYPHSVWARQLNIESLDAARTKINNKGGNLWILGLKTEGKGSVINTSAGGKTELLGALIYPVQDFTVEEKKQAAFINNESSQSLIYSVSAYGSNKNYDIQVEETRNGTKRQLSSQTVSSRIPLFVGYQP